MYNMFRLFQLHLLINKHNVNKGYVCSDYQKQYELLVDQCVQKPRPIVFFKPIII